LQIHLAAGYPVLTEAAGNPLRGESAMETA